MDDEQLLRYSRQIMLPQIDVAGQRRLGEAAVLIIGLGGLGSPAAMYLATAGIGRLVLADDDRVDLSNLQRQIIHDNEHIGVFKVDSARAHLAALNPLVNIETLNERLEDGALREMVAAVDVVLDCSDNFATRFAVNAACLAADRPLISGAAIRMEGQLSVFNRTADSPCYRCLYREEGQVEETCSENGILGPVAGAIGALQAVEAIKILLDIGTPLDGYLLVLDAMSMDWRKLRLKKDPQCPACGRR